MEATLRSAVSMTVITVLIFLLPLVSCSTERSERRAGEDQRAGEAPANQKGSARTEEARETSGDAPQPEAVLVPITHLTSTQRSVGADKLSKVRGLAVGRGSRGEAGKFLGRSDFEVFNSDGAVVDHVSRTPGALGLVPWDDVVPRVKLLAVDGESLLDPDAAGPEDYPL
ncbi:MAG TPA: hypothetical protein VEZ19_10865, partial [Rubrobacter sp.]|nr:hypothetical protein [Rubrobacter sp.]